MSFEPLVSIVIPVFNGSNYMSTAIDSALAQTYPNIEILVINDGSSDDGKTEAIAKSYGEKIRYFRKENGGCGSALNLGISEMRGEYFSWLSHDDVYLPQKIEHQIDVLNLLPDKNTILYGGWELIDSQSNFITTVQPHTVQPPEKLNISLFPLLRGLLHGCSMLIPSRYFREIGGFDVNLPSTQDYSLWFNFLRVAPIHYDSRVLIRSRIHPDQGTNKILGHIEECNHLWSGFIKRLTTEEMIRMEGSRYSFLVKTGEFLEGTPYKKAAQLARDMADTALANISISVIIPFHNRIPWVIESIQSVLSQSHRNFELILVDDGSTDDITIIHEFVQSDRRVKYTKQEHSGPAKARNRGIDLATGDYVAFLDSDDYFLPEKLSTQLHYMETQQLKISHTSYIRVDFEKNPLGTISSVYFSGYVFPRILASCPVAMPTVMVRTSLLKVNKFPENMRVGEDVCLWIKLASKYIFGAIETPLSVVRVGPSSASVDAKKQCLGLVGIAYFALSDPFLAGYSRQIKILLSVANATLTSSENHVSLTHSVIRRPGHSGLLMKFFKSLKQNGLRVTLWRVRHYLKI